MRIIVLSAMHGRNETVKYCLLRMSFIDKVIIYSSREDGRFLKDFDLIKTKKVKNEPLSFKWNEAVKSLKDVDFDAVILLGSDDYVDVNFVQFIENNIGNFDLIAFKDIYFEHPSGFYYWPGYQNNRKGEPAGAGKTYSREFLESINFELFPGSQNNSLDGMSWKVCKEAGAKILVTSLKDNNLMLCDVKDGEGITPLSSIKGIVKL